MLGRVGRRAAGLAAGLALVAAACGDDPGPETGADDGVEAAEVERVELEAPLTGELVAVDGMLVAGVPDDDEAAAGPAGVQVSDDGARRWEPVELPEAPDRLQVDLDQPTVVGGVAVVTGRALIDDGGIAVPGGGAYVWTSADGVRWRGGELADSGPAFGSVGVAGADGLLVAGFTTGPPDFQATGTFALWRSRDGGASWQPAEVPDLGLQPGETAGVGDVWTLPDGRLAASVTTSGGAAPGVSMSPGGRPEEAPAPEQPEREGPVLVVSGDGGATWDTAPCPERDTAGHACAPPGRAGDLLYRGDEVSVDGGRSWQPVAVIPAAEPDALELSLDGVVEDGAGGWLAAASVEVPSDESYGFLLRSTDGVRWEQLLAPDPCRDGEIGRPNSSVSVPVRLGEGWLVAYSCLALSTPEVAELFAVPAGSAGTGGEPTPIAGTERRDVSYGDPVALGGTVVVPELAEGRSEIVALSLVTP